MVTVYRCDNCGSAIGDAGCIVPGCKLSATFVPPPKPNEQLASAELDGPGNKVFETRAAKPPGVTVRIRRNGDGQSFGWWASLDGVPISEFAAMCIGPFPTPEDAEADCETCMQELVARLLGLPNWEAVPASIATDLKITFVRE